MKKRRSWQEERRIDQQSNYDAVNTEQVKLKLNRKTDKDILDWLGKVRYTPGKTMQGEIKRLIRKEITEDKEKNCRCTPTENRGTELKNNSDNEKTPLEVFLKRPDIAKYMKKYPDATINERTLLMKWVNDGNNIYENVGHYTDDCGITMDFIQGLRTDEELRECH